MGGHQVEELVGQQLRLEGRGGEGRGGGGGDLELS